MTKAKGRAVGSVLLVLGLSAKVVKKELTSFFEFPRLAGCLYLVKAVLANPIKMRMSLTSKPNSLDPFF